MSPQQGSLRPGAFLESLIRFLLPFFIGNAVDIEAARAEILETLNAYGTRTRAEMLTAARIIALGMSTLDTLAEAKSADLSPAMKIRWRGCANSLNRATVQAEKALDQSLACELPPQPDPVLEPLNDASSADMQRAIEHVQAALQEHRNNRLATTPADSAATLQAHRPTGYPNGATSAA